MTAATHVFGAGDREAAGRWAASLLVVLALHAGVAMLLLSRRVAIEPPAAPPAAVMIDLAPLPVTVPVETQPAKEPEPVTPPPPEPPQQLEAAPLPQPEPVPVPLPPPEPVAPPQAVTVPVPQPKPPAKAKPKPKKVEPRPRVAEPRPLETVAPPPVPAPAPVAAAPPSASAAAARANWQAQLAAWLSRHKRYPRAAQDQQQQGRAYLRFSLDRHGRVLASRLERSSGFPLLDEEVTALIQRAQPLPAAPAEVPGERFELVVPVEFSLSHSRR